MDPTEVTVTRAHIKTGTFENWEYKIWRLGFLDGSRRYHVTFRPIQQTTSSDQDRALNATISKSYLTLWTAQFGIRRLIKKLNQTAKNC